MIHGLDAVIWCLLFMMVILRYHEKVTECADSFVKNTQDWYMYFCNTYITNVQNETK